MHKFVPICRDEIQHKISIITLLVTILYSLDINFDNLPFFLANKLPSTSLRRFLLPQTVYRFPKPLRSIPAAGDAEKEPTG